MHFLDTFQVTNASFGRKAVYDGEQIEEVENNAIPMEDLNQPNDGTIHFAGNEKYFHNLLYISSIMSFFHIDKKSSFLQYGHHSNPDQIITVDITFVTKVGTRSTSSV